MTSSRARSPSTRSSQRPRSAGSKANDSFPADFIRINLLIQTNLIHAAFRHKVRKLLFLGSSCIYPKLAPQPLKEEYLLTGKLEPTNDAYAIAKIAGILMCKSYNRQHGTNFIAAMPTNLYGPGDNFDLQSSHVLPAWIRKFHEAKVTGQASVELWGTGNVRRELLYVEDLADALVFLMNHFDAGREREDEKMFVNIGLGEDIVLRDLAELVRGIVGYSGAITWNASMPDGTPASCLTWAGFTPWAGRRNTRWRRASEGPTPGIWRTSRTKPETSSGVRCRCRGHWQRLWQRQGQ